jgi:hypothetical protein
MFVVDDNSDSQALTSALLTTNGHEIRAVPKTRVHPEERTTYE